MLDDYRADSVSIATMAATLGLVFKGLSNMKYLVLVIQFFIGSAMAADAEHHALATVFDRLSGAQDKTKLMDSVLPTLLVQLPELKEHEGALRQLFVELFSSQEYVNGKVEVYSSVFSKRELRELIKLVQTPAYQLMQEKRYKLNRGMMQNTQNLISGNSLKIMAVLKNDTGNDELEGQKNH